MIFVKNFKRNCEKRIILGTSDAWSTSHLSQRTSVLYCRLSDFNLYIDTTFMSSFRVLKKILGPNINFITRSTKIGKCELAQ